MFTQKVVIVTGASSGIGAAIAIAFAKDKAVLTITGRSVDNLEDTAKKCLDVGGVKPLMVVGDLTNESHLKDIVNTTIKTYGKIDILINNAGILKNPTLENTTVEDYDATFAINVKAVFFLTQLALPYLTQTKGNIVNISSLAGMRSFSGAIVYNMSKSALDQFTKCAALELAPKGVRVNSVNPGYVPTNITRSFYITEEQRKKLYESYINVIPLGRNCTLEDVVEAVLYFASDRAGFITGHLLPLDGGRGLVTPRPNLD